MNTMRMKIKNNKLLTFVIITYMLLFIFMPTKAIQSLINSLYYVKEMVIIMPVILLLTSLIEAWVPKKSIENALGEGSGFKGYIFSFLLGSFSAGPIYAAFPVCKMLLKKGSSISNIIVILSTWAVIKIPMLANEAKFLGPKFMAIRWILTTISIFVMAYIISRIVKKEEIPMDDLANNSEGQILSINEAYCIGCGLCTKICPYTFAMENKKARVITKVVKPEQEETVRALINKCPAKAIKYNN